MATVERQITSLVPFFFFSFIIIFVFYDDIYVYTFVNFRRLDTIYHMYMCI